MADGLPDISGWATELRGSPPTPVFAPCARASTGMKLDRTETANAVQIWSSLPLGPCSATAYEGLTRVEGGALKPLRRLVSPNRCPLSPTCTRAARPPFVQGPTSYGMEPIRMRLGAYSTARPRRSSTDRSDSNAGWSQSSRMSLVSASRSGSVAPWPPDPSDDGFARQHR